MKIRAKLNYTYLLIIVVVGAFVLFRIYQLFYISDFVNQKLPPVITELSTASYLNDLSHYIRYYDEVLTQSARNYAFTSDKKWRERYLAAVPELYAKIKEAIDKGDAIDKQFFKDIDEANLALVGLEEKSLALVDGGQASAAVSILEGAEYAKQKKIYSDGLSRYLQRRNQELQSANTVSTKGLDEFRTQLGDIINFNVFSYAGVMAAVAFIILFMSWLIFRLISKPIAELNRVVKAITKGDLSQRATIKTKDELQEVGDAFNIMADKLKKSLEKTEAEVKERTADLEKINKFMTGRELKMIELKKQIQDLKEAKQSKTES